MKAYELLDSPEKWTTKVGQKDKDNNHVDVGDLSACKFCIYGAIRHCYRHDQKDSELIGKVLKELKFIDTKELFLWNDSPERTFDDVRNLLIKLDI